MLTLRFLLQVIALAEYRGQLFDYLKSRMQAIAPNLTVLVGELVGARLIAHAGSLLNLAKHPASTVQILGAEKALFRYHDTAHPDCALWVKVAKSARVKQQMPSHIFSVACDLDYCQRYTQQVANSWNLQNLSSTDFDPIFLQ